MSSILLYLGITLIGCILGSRLRSKKEKLKWISKVQTVLVIFLLFVLGLRLGANDEVLNNIDTIGVTALVLALCALAGSLGVTFTLRKLMKIDREGNRK